jgi:hypothetical protein
VSITANHPDIHAASAPETVAPKLVVLRLDALQPLSFRQAMVAVRKATEAVRVTAHRPDMFLTGTVDPLNLVFQSSLYRILACHL